MSGKNGKLYSNFFIIIIYLKHETEFAITLAKSPKIVTNIPIYITLWGTEKQNKT